MDPLSVLGLVVVTVFLGFTGYYFYRKTRIPDVIWLLLLGILIGPVLHLYSQHMFLSLSPIMSAIALTIILFEAGITIDLYSFIRTLPKSALLSVLTFVPSVLWIGIAVHVLSGGSIGVLDGLLLGSIVGGTSTVSITAILANLELLGVDIEEVKRILTLESVITDPLCITTALMIIRFMRTPALSPLEGISSIVKTISAGTFIGFIAGVAWLFLLNRFKEAIKYDYILTLAVLFATYVVAEVASVEGSGIIAALVFGLVLGNSTSISRMLKLEHELEVNREKMIEFHEEITFLIKSFFFVFLGIIVQVNVNYLIYGLSAILIIQAVRWLVSRAFMSMFNLGKLEADVIGVMCPNGLAAAVISQLPLIYGIPGAELYPNTVFIIIMGTVLWASLVGAHVIKRSIAPGQAQAEAAPPGQAPQPSQPPPPQPPPPSSS